MGKKAFLVSLAAALLLGSGCTVIEDGEVGVSKSFGRIDDKPVPQGVALVIPIARQIERWNVKLQERKERAAVPSSEGLIVGLDTSVLYRVLPDR
ncbi:MAG: SPFH domain-containing protein, partial [Candidatus Binatia bacterium]